MTSTCCVQHAVTTSYRTNLQATADQSNAVRQKGTLLTMIVYVFLTDGEVRLRIPHLFDRINYIRAATRRSVRCNCRIVLHRQMHSLLTVSWRGYRHATVLTNYSMSENSLMYRWKVLSAFTRNRNYRKKTYGKNDAFWYKIKYISIIKSIVYHSDHSRSC